MRRPREPWEDRVAVVWSLMMLVTVAITAALQCSRVYW